MKTLITGGAGFIGSHLVDYLLEAGDEVVVLDDMSTGSPRNLAGAIDNPRLTVIHGSILNVRDVREAVASADRVFHLAAVVGVKLIVEQPLHGLHVNLHGTENVLAAAAEAKVPVLLVSTSEIYGKNTADKLSEDSDRILGSPLLSRWTYAAAKGIDEALAQAYSLEHGLEVSIIRLFNTVGPRQTGRYGMVVPNFVSQALAGDPVRVFGDGSQTRCFSYVGDVIPAMVRIADDPATRGQAYNLGGAEEVSILDLANRVIAELGSASTVQLVPYEEAYGAGFEDMQRRVPDNSKAGAAVGYKPTTSLEHIIREVAKDISDRATLQETQMATPTR